MPKQIPLTKLKAITLYFCERTNPIFLGKVKLMKLFYFLDFIHLKQHGTPVTWDTYIKMEHGPVPSAVKNYIYSVDDEPDEALFADTILVEHKDGSKIHRVRAIRKLSKKELAMFSQSELEVLEQVSKRFENSNQRIIETEAQREAPYKETSPGGIIPYTLAAHDPDSKFSEEELKFFTEL